MSEAGRAVSTPVLITENASLTDQRQIIATLGGLGDAVAGLDGPAILIIGEVASLAVAAPVILTETQVLRAAQ